MSLVGQQSLPFDVDVSVSDVETPKLAAPTTAANVPATHAERIAATTGAVPWIGNEGRTRFRGKGKKGVPTNAEKADSDLIEAIKSLETARAQLAAVYRTEWPKPSAKREAELAAMAHVNLATRFCDEALDRVRYDERIAKLSTGKR